MIIALSSKFREKKASGKPGLPDVKEAENVRFSASFLVVYSPATAMRWVMAEASPPSVHTSAR